MWRLSKGSHQELLLFPHKAVQSKYIVYKNVLVSYIYLIIDRIISVKVRCGDLIKARSLTAAGLWGRSIQNLNTTVKTNHILQIKKKMTWKNCQFFMVVYCILKVISHISMQHFHHFKSYNSWQILKITTVDKHFCTKA